MGRYKFIWAVLLSNRSRGQYVRGAAAAVRFEVAVLTATHFIGKKGSWIPASLFAFSRLFSNCLVRLQALQMGETERRAQVFAQVHPVLFRNRKENIYNFRIELCSRAAANFLARMGNGQRFAVRAVADHGVERIRHGKYTRAERNLFAL